MKIDKLVLQINKKKKRDRFFFSFKIRKVKKLLTKTALKLRSTSFLIHKSEFKQSEEDIFKVLNILVEDKFIYYKTLESEDEDYLEITFVGATKEAPKYKIVKKLETPTQIKENEEKHEEKSLIRDDLKTNNEEKVAEKNDQEEPILADEEGSYEF